MSLTNEQIIDKLEGKIDEQSAQIARIDDSLTRVLDTIQRQSDQISQINTI